MAETEVNGAKIRFEIHGEGLPIVYTPGGFWPMERGRAVAEQLAPLGYKVLIYDRPNTGESDVVVEDTESVFHLFGEYLNGLLTALGFQQAGICGGSGGELTSLALAHLHPEIVRGLILISPPTDDLSLWQGIAEQTCRQPARLSELCGMQAISEITIGWFDWPKRVELNAHNRERLLALDPKFFTMTMRRWADWMVAGRAHICGLTERQLGMIECPTLVLAGPDKDVGAHPRHTALYTSRCIPQSKLIIPYESMMPDEIEKIRSMSQEKGGEWYDALLSPMIHEFIRDVEQDKA